jgi:hypothetical protein
VSTFTMLTVNKLIPQGQGQAFFAARWRCSGGRKFGLTGQGPQIAANPVGEFRLGRTT